MTATKKSHMIISRCRKISQNLTSLYDKNNKPVERNTFNLIKGMYNNNNKKLSSQLLHRQKNECSPLRIQSKTRMSAIQR